MPKKKKAANSSGSIPSMRAFFACEAASQDPSGNKTLYGLFDSMFSSHFPGLFKPFCIYAKVFGGRGKQPVTLSVVGPDGVRLPVETQMSVVLKPGFHNDLIFQMIGVPLTRPGKLRFTVNVGGHQIGWPLEIDVRLVAVKK